MGGPYGKDLREGFEQSEREARDRGESASAVYSSVNLEPLTEAETKFNLKNFTELELERELESRRAIKKPTAKPIHSHMFDRVYNEAIDVIDDAETHGKIPKDAEENLYEAVLEAVFGENVWEWLGEKTGKFHCNNLS